MSNNKVKCTFRISETARMTEKALITEKGKNSIIELAAGINALALRYENICIQKYRASVSNSSDYLKYVKKAISSLLLEDSSNKEICLSNLEYNPFHLVQLQFIYANILEENQYVKDKVHILAEYMDNNGVLRKGNFVAKKEWYEKLNQNNVVGGKKVLCGFCKRKDVKVPGKVKYDKYSHSSYHESEGKKQVTILTIFTVFQINENGVLVTSRNELLLYNMLFCKNIIFEIPQKENMFGFKPDAEILIDNKKSFIEILDSDNSNEIIRERKEKISASNYGYYIMLADLDNCNLKKVI